MIKDLEIPTIAQDVVNWTIQTASTTLITSCTGENMLGGYNTFVPGDYFERTYVTNETHSYVYLKFSVWIIDSWNENDYVGVEIDNGAQTFSLMGINGWDFVSNLCGILEWKDLGEITIFFIIQHTAPTLKLKFIAGMYQIDDEFFGVSKISINLFNTTIHAPSFPYLRCLGDMVFTGCQETLVSNHTLTSSTPCHSSCNYCIGPNIEDCLNCIEERFFFAGDLGCINCPYECNTCINYTLCIDPTCNDHNLYAYWDGVCSSDCQFPLQIRNITSYPACVYPCDSSEYLYWNGTCGTSCPLPYSISVKGERYFCNTGCPPGTFLYWNSSCLASCDPPLIQETVDNYTLCKSYCTSSDFLYENGSCLPTCISPPYVILNQSGSLYCNRPCPNSISMWDGSCYSKCDSPTIFISNSTGNFCIYQCQISQYLNTNGNCSDNCTLPLKLRIFKTRQFCDYPCSPGSYLYSGGLCKTSCNSPMIPENNTGQSFCNSPCLNSQFIHSNGSCISSCDSPNIKKTSGILRYCDEPCGNNSFRYSNNSCLSTCIYPYINSTIYGELRCDFVCGDYYLLPNGSCSPNCSNYLVSN